jgi:hypothetical protein
MCLVALEDPGLTVFPTHRLVRGRGPEAYERLAGTLREQFAIEEVAEDALAPPASPGPAVFGYLDSHFKRPFRLTLQGEPDSGLEGPLRHLDTALLEALVLKGPLGPERRRHLAPARLRLRPRRRAGRRARHERRVRRRLPAAAHAGRADPRDRRGRPEHAAEVDLLLPEGPHRPGDQPFGLTGVPSMP